MKNQAPLPVQKEAMTIPDPLVAGALWYLELEGARYFVKAWVPPLPGGRRP
jgi:hypothetical protein